MRSDMFKVIVERPRKGKFGHEKATRRRNDPDGPMRLGMRAGYGHRALNENLAPLRRYLHKQVGRPWDKVLGEISAHIDRRNTVQQHIYQHIDDFIATRVERHNSRIVDLKTRWRTWTQELYQPLYVDPRTGLIRTNSEHRSWAQRRRDEKEQARAEVAARFRKFDELRHLHLIDGQWYEVRLAALPSAEYEKIHRNGKWRELRIDAPVFDVLLKKLVRRERYFDAPRYYAVSKRQLSKRELGEHGLR